MSDKNNGKNNTGFWVVTALTIGLVPSAGLALFTMMATEYEIKVAIGVGAAVFAGSELMIGLATYGFCKAKSKCAPTNNANENANANANANETPIQSNVLNK